MTIVCRLGFGIRESGELERGPGVGVGDRERAPGAESAFSHLPHPQAGSVTVSLKGDPQFSPILQRPLGGGVGAGAGGECPYSKLRADLKIAPGGSTRPRTPHGILVHYNSKGDHRRRRAGRS